MDSTAPALRERVLVTGHRGTIGVPLAAFLRRRGYHVAGFDRAHRADVLDLAAVRREAAGCAATVLGWHAARRWPTG